MINKEPTLIYKAYAGIGSKKTPQRFLFLMEDIAKDLFHRGFTLRSGGAEGADSAFEKGSQRSEIFLPWPKFRDNESTFVKPTSEAYKLSSKFHPVWDRLSAPVKSLMARNAHQVLGYDLKTPSKFIVCWTQDGCEDKKDRTARTGGTGLAIAIASYFSIPIFNLQNPNSITVFYDRFLGGDI
jgi:hypothetical protein